MGRFLFVVPPFTGHVNPTVSVGRELADRGHDVVWAGHGGVLASLLGDGDRRVSVADAPTDALLDAVAGPSAGLRGVAALRFLWEDVLIPLADVMVPDLDEACARFGPDVLVVDQQTLAGAVVARRLGIRWATTATTSAEFVDPLAGLPKVAGWVRGLLDELVVRHGLPVGPDPRFSDDLVIGFTTEALVGPIDRYPPQFLLVGPSIDRRPHAGDFPWGWLDDRKRCVLVSLGTVNVADGTRFFQVAAEALGARDVQAVIVASPGQLSDVADNILVRPRVPQVELLDRVDAVVSHGGHNTVCEALAKGLPLVLAPIRDDQPVIAQQVVEAGAGVRLKFGRVGSRAMGTAIDDVLDIPRYREAARAVRESFDVAGGTATAADHLEKMS